MKDEYLAYEPAMEDSAPFYGEIELFRRKEGYGYLTAGLVQFDGLDRIGTADQVHIDIVDMPGIARDRLQFFVHEFQQNIGQGDTEGDQDHEKRAQDDQKNFPSAVFFGLFFCFHVRINSNEMPRVRVLLL
jgi:hypothetical protein